MTQQVIIKDHQQRLRLVTQCRHHAADGTCPLALVVPVRADGASLGSEWICVMFPRMLADRLQSTSHQVLSAVSPRELFFLQLSVHLRNVLQLRLEFLSLDVCDVSQNIRCLLTSFQSGARYHHVLGWSAVFLLFFFWSYRVLSLDGSSDFREQRVRLLILSLLPTHGFVSSFCCCHRLWLHACTLHLLSFSDLFCVDSSRNSPCMAPATRRLVHQRSLEVEQRWASRRSFEPRQRCRRSSMR